LLEVGVPKKNRSAIKRARQAETKRVRNAHTKSTMKTYIKKLMTAMEKKNKDELNDAFKKAVAYISKASSKGVIHKNNAARKIARLSKKVHALSQPGK